MAWEQDRTVIIRIYFQDDDLATGRAEFHLPVAQLDLAPAFAQNIMAYLAPLSNCVIPRYTISLTAHDNATVTSGPGLAADVGAFIFSTENADERFIMCIPGIKEDKLADAGSFPGIAIDVADSDVQAFIAATLDGIGGIAPVAPWGADLIALNVAYKQIRPQHLNRYR